MPRSLLALRCRVIVCVVLFSLYFLFFPIFSLAFFPSTCSCCCWCFQRVVLLLFFFSLCFTPAFRSVLSVLFSTNSPCTFSTFLFVLAFAFVVAAFICIARYCYYCLLLLPPVWPHQRLRLEFFCYCFCFCFFHFLLACLPPFNPSIRPRYNCVISRLFCDLSFPLHPHIHTYTYSCKGIRLRLILLFFFF